MVDNTILLKRFLVNEKKITNEIIEAEGEAKKLKRNKNPKQGLNLPLNAMIKTHPKIVPHQALNPPLKMLSLNLNQ